MAVDCARARRVRRRLAACAISAAALPCFAQGEQDSTPSLGFDGRLQLDHDAFDGVYVNDGHGRSATYLRRARIGASGRLHRHWKYAAEVDVDGDGKTTWKMAMLEFRGLPFISLSLGRFDPDFGLEQAVSSKWTTAIERSAMWDLAPDVAESLEGRGVQLSAAGARHYGSIGGFAKLEHDSVVARAVLAPLARSGRVLHLGASYAANVNARSDGGIRSRLGVRGVSEHDEGNRVTLARDLEDGSFGSDRSWALEFAFAAGPYSVQAERLQRRLSGGGAQAERVATGHYVQLAWTVSGEVRPYEIDGAKFGRIDPERAGGAWEVFYRHDRLGVRGGPELLGEARDRSHATTHTIGLNWYASDALKLSANLLHAHSAATANDAGDRSGSAFSMRLQWVF